VAVAVLTLLAACRESGSASPPVSGATVPTAAPTTTTTNPYAVPPVIDAAYFNRVLAGLEAAYGDLLRIVYTTRSIPPEVIDRIKALYATNGQVNLTLADIQEEMRRNFSTYLPSPGNVRTTVADLISATSSCMYAKVDRDYSAVVHNPSPLLRTQWMAVRRLPIAESTAPFNPTGWGIIYEGVTSTLQAPTVNPCSEN